MSLKGLFQLGKRLLKGKKESATPATGQQQKLITYEKKAPQETGLELATKELRNPPIVRKQTKALYMGDDVAPAFGSSTYDWAMKIGPGRYTADEWLNHLTSTRKENFKIFGKAATRKVREPKKFTYDSGPFAGKQAVVTADELFDTNLAVFNSAGDLTGGLLFAAKKFGLKLDANEIGSMIKLNPINRLKAVELGVPDEAIEQLITKSKSISAQLDNIAKKYPSSEVGLSLTDAAYHLRPLKVGGHTDATTVNSVVLKFKNAVRKARDGTNINQSDFKNLNRMIGEVDEAAAKVTNKQNKTQYAKEEAYTLPGGKNYRETIFKLDEEIPTNQNAFTSQGHFSEHGKNQIYHVRFDTRVTPDGKKVLLIHEIQSDVNQKIAKVLSKSQQLDGENRVNPFNADIELNLLISERGKISARLNKALSEQDVSGINANAQILNDVQRKISNVIQKNPRRKDYFPMVEADQYGDHALKYLLNKAAKENIDYVAVAPFERLSMRQGYKAGNERFYGYANGKGINNKGSSIMANVMKRAAKFYDSKTETIKLNLSDPKKPYKNISKKEMTFPEDHKFSGKKIYSRVHDEASDVQQQGFRFIEDGDPNLYFDAFAVKVSPLMRYTQKTYKAKGGLVVDMFKPIGYNRAWL